MSFRRNKWLWLVLWALLTLGVTWAYKGRASEPLWALREATLEYKRFMPNGRSPYFLGIGFPKEELDWTLKTEFVGGVVYWDWFINSMTDDAQYRKVGLNIRLGLRLTPWLSAGYEHYSQHGVDRPFAYGQKFPVEDSFGFRMRWYLNPESPKTLFP